MQEMVAGKKEAEKTQDIDDRMTSHIVRYLSIQFIFILFSVGKYKKDNIRPTVQS